jgi:hypothetical protein
MTGTWNVRMQPNSTLVVNAYDHNQQMNPDAWNVEIRDATGRIDRSIAFPNTSNAPVDGVITSGNATVAISYFDGTGRFPATVSVRFTTFAPPPPPSLPVEPFLNPIIVIYSASWATLIALILVIFWLHQRRVKRREMQAAETAAETAETKRD